MLDDLDSRPGSAASVLRTLVGLHLRGVGGWMPVSALVELMGAAGHASTSTRSAVSRVAARGLLVREVRDGVSGYAVDPRALPMLERGDRKIFRGPEARTEDGWVLVSYTVPEAQRARRHQLRRHLQWMGCGAVADALWIAPHRLRHDVGEVLDALGMRDSATVFDGAALASPGDLRRHCAAWWDLEGIARRHREFLERFDASGPGREAQEDAEAFAARLRLVDAWRPLPYLDPGLPAEALPADWPGLRALEVFRAGLDGLEPAATRHLHRVLSERTGTTERTWTGGRA